MFNYRTFLIFVRLLYIYLYCHTAAKLRQRNRKTTSEDTENVIRINTVFKMKLIGSEKEKEIRAVLRGENVKGICSDLYNKGVISSPRDQTVWEVLRGDSRKIDTLEAVVKEARRLKAERNARIANL